MGYARGPDPLHHAERDRRQADPRAAPARAGLRRAAAGAAASAGPGASATRSPLIAEVLRDRNALYRDDRRRRSRTATRSSWSTRRDQRAALSRSRSQSGHAGIGLARRARVVDVPAGDRCCRCRSTVAAPDGVRGRHACASNIQPRDGERAGETSTAVSSDRCDCDERRRPPALAWREPMVWLVVGAAAGVGRRRRRAAGRSPRAAADDAVADPVQRTAQIQVADLGPGRSARAQLELTRDRARRHGDMVEVLPVSGDVRSRRAAAAGAAPSGARRTRPRARARSRRELGWRATPTLDGAPRLERAARARATAAGACRAGCRRASAPRTWRPALARRDERRGRRAVASSQHDRGACAADVLPLRRTAAAVAARRLTSTASSARSAATAARPPRNGSATRASTTTTACAAQPAGARRRRSRPTSRAGIATTCSPNTRAPSPAAARSSLLTDGMRCAACAWLIDRALRARARRARSRAPTRSPAASAWPGIRARTRAVACRCGAWPRSATARTSPPARRASARAARERNRCAAAPRHRRARRDAGDDVRRGAVPGHRRRDVAADARLLPLDHLPGVDAGGVLFRLAVPRRLLARTARSAASGMDTLVADSTLLAYFASVVETRARRAARLVRRRGDVRVPAAGGAHARTARARSVASAQVDALARARPALRDARTRRRQPRSGAARRRWRVGDVACVAAGEARAGRRRAARRRTRASRKSLLTGESHAGAQARRRRRSSPAPSCRERPARLRVHRRRQRRRGCRSSRALVEQAQAHRPALARAADRIADCVRARRCCVVAAVVLCRLACLHDPARAFEVDAGAAGDQLPVRAVAGGAGGAGGGPRRAGAASACCRCAPMRSIAWRASTDVVFDKTGTLGDGRAGAGRRRRRSTACRRDAGAAHRRRARARQPASARAAFAPCRDAADRVAATSRSVPGLGIEGTVDGVAGASASARVRRAVATTTARCGSATARARSRASRCARASAPMRAAAIAALRAQGLDVHLSSGDGRRGGRALRRAAAASTDAAGAADRRKHKLAYVRALQRAGPRRARWSATASTMRRCSPAPMSRIAIGRWRGARATRGRPGADRRRRCRASRRRSRWRGARAA